MIKKAFLTLIISVVSVLSFAGVVLGDDTNLVKNPGFEDFKNGQLTNWSYVLDEKASVNISDDSHSGSKSILIKNSAPVDTMVRQDLKVIKGKLYKVSAWVKAKIRNQAGSSNITLYYVENNSDCKGIYTSKELMDTSGKWEKIEFSIKTNKDIDDPLTLAVRLGGQGTPNEGEVYFDDIEFIEIDEKNISATHFEFQTTKTEQKENEKDKVSGLKEDDKSNNGPANGNQGGIKYFWLVVALIAILAVLNHKGILFSKKGKDNVENSDDKNSVIDKDDKKNKNGNPIKDSFFDD